MTARRTRAAGLALAAVLALVASACGAGGFGSKEPTTPDRTIKSYVALGDGFAAAPYTGRTTSKDGCLRSDASYPTLVAATLGVAEFKDVSCTGATTKAFEDTFRPAGARRSVKAQLDAISPDTDLVTLSIGIMNDDLLDNMFRICVSLPCVNEVPLTDYKDILPRIASKITSAVRAVTAKAPQAYVVVVGYPELLSFDKHCRSTPPMDQTQLYWTTKVWQQFTTAVSSAARQAGAAYVDVQRLSETHAPCSKHPWVNSLKTVKGSRIAYHPTAAEQRAVADQVAAQVRTR